MLLFDSAFASPASPWPHEFGLVWSRWRVRNIGLRVATPGRATSASPLTRPVCPLDFPASTAALVIFIAPLPEARGTGPRQAEERIGKALRERHPLRGKGSSPFFVVRADPACSSGFTHWAPPSASRLGTAGRRGSTPGRRRSSTNTSAPGAAARKPVLVPGSPPGAGTRRGPRSRTRAPRTPGRRRRKSRRRRGGGERRGGRRRWWW